MFYVGNSNGLLEFDGSAWRLFSLPSYSLVSSIYYQKSTDRVYVGSTDDFGYFEKDSSGIRHFISIRHLVEWDKRIPDIYQIKEHEGAIYFVTINMILKWHREEMKIISIEEASLFTIGGKLFVSLLNKGVAIFEDDTVKIKNEELKFEFDHVFGEVPLKDNIYLLGTYGNGFYTFDTETFKSQKWKTPASEFASSQYVADVETWQDSLILYSTYEGGLAISNRRGTKLTIINEKKGLNSDFLGLVYSDLKRNIWLLSYYGLDIIRLDKNANIQSGAIPKISHLTVNGTDIPSSSLDRVESFPSDVSFHYYIPGFFSKDLEYSSYLEGVENEWSEWSPSISREYKNLTAGEYLFKVRARSSNGNVSDVASKNIIIPLPWYKSIYTYIGVIISIIAVVIFVSRLLTLRLKQHNKNLEQLIKDRTLKLVEANKDLKQINAELDNFVYRSSHDLVAPLKSLKGLIHIAKADDSPINRTEYLDKMNSRVSKLEDFIKSIMEYSVNSKQKIEKSEVKLDEIIDSIVQDLTYYVNADKVEFIKAYDLDTVIFTDGKRLAIILSNLITNAIKYHDYEQSNQYVEIRMKTLGNNQMIEVIDNGRGIERDYLTKIFDMFFRASDSSEGSGLGLYIVKDMITKIGGDIDVKSEVGEGSTFTVILPNV
ncbi:MAG: ATP-binding protein [Bacteroidota bacterium]